MSFSVGFGWRWSYSTRGIIIVSSSQAYRVDWLNPNVQISGIPKRKLFLYFKVKILMKIDTSCLSNLHERGALKFLGWIYKMLEMVNYWRNL